jgi:riboflavin biosynthesis pyrimidine reductase
VSKVFIHATVTLDGLMADTQGGIDWMFGFPTADEDGALMTKVWDRVGAVVGGANKAQTIEEGELPYGEPMEKDGVRYTFVVDDIEQAVHAAKADAGDKDVSLLGGSISRQCLKLGLVDEIQLHVVPVLLGDGISLFGGLGERINLERIETAAFASETHLRYRVVA